MAVDVQKLTLLLETKGIKLTKQELRDLDASAKQSASSIAGITTAVIALAATAKLLKDSVKAFTEFEAAISKVEAVSGASATQLQKLTKTAKDLGAQTRYTSSEVAGLQFEFSKLGFTANEIVNVQGAVLNLAMAAGTDLANAAMKSGEAMRMFGLDSSEMGRVVDVMAASFSGSALDIEKLSNAFTYVGPIAKVAGVSIEGTAGALGTLADRGIHGSIAGTHMRRILLEMGNESSKLSKHLGFTVKSSDDFNKALAILNKQGLDNTKIMDFVGKRSVATFQTLIQGADSVKELTEELEASNGAGQRMADIMMDNLEGDTIRLQSAFNNLTITIGEQFGPALRSATQAMTEFVGSIDEEDLYAYSTGLGIVAAGVLVLKREVILASKAFKMLRATMIATGWGALAVGIGLATGALLDFLGVFDDGADQIEDYDTGLKDVTDSTKNFNDSLSGIRQNSVDWNLVFDKGAYSEGLRDLKKELEGYESDLKNSQDELQNYYATSFDNFNVPAQAASQGREFAAQQFSLVGRQDDPGPLMYSADLSESEKSMMYAQAVHIDSQIESYEDLVRLHQIINGEVQLDLDNQMFINRIAGKHVDNLSNMAILVEENKNNYGQTAILNKELFNVFNANVDTAKTELKISQSKINSTKEEINQLNDQIGLNDKLKKQVQDQAFSEKAIREHYVKTLISKEQERAKNAIIIQQRLYEKDLLSDMNNTQLKEIGNLLQKGKTMAEILRMYGDESYAIDTISERYAEFAKKQDESFKKQAESQLQNLLYEGEISGFRQSDINAIAAQLKAGKDMNTILKDRYNIELELLEMSESEKLSLIQEFHAKQRELTEGGYQAEVDLINARRDAYIAAGVDTVEANKMHQKELNNLNLETAQRFISGVSAGAQALYETGDMHRKDARNIAIAETAVNTYASATAAYKAMAGIPIVGPALGVMAAAAAVAAGNANVEKIKSQYSEPPKKPKDPNSYLAQFTEYGMSGVVTEPTKIIAGEAGPEAVNITPLTPGKNAFGGGGSGAAISVNLSGNILTKDFVEDELAEKIKDALGRGVDFGID